MSQTLTAGLTLAAQGRYKSGMRFNNCVLAVIAVLGVGSVLAEPAVAQAPKTGEPPGRSAPQAKPEAEGERSAPGTGAVDPKSADPKAGPKSATPAPGQKGQGGPQSQAKGKDKKGPPPIAVQQPRTPAEREKALSDLYALLATADDEAAAKTVSGNIERLWLNSGSDTIAALMDRAMQATQAKNTDLALRLLDAVVDLAPDYAEGWN